MNVRRISLAARTLLAAQKRGISLAAPLAMALEAEQLLQFPDAAAGLTRLHAQVAELEAARAAVAALHTRYPDSAHCRADGEAWPCRTVTTLEKDTPAVAGAAFTPAATAVLVGLALALREQPTGRQVLDGLDELGEHVVCDGDPAEVASWVAALCSLARVQAPVPGPAMVYRVEHESIVAGLYTTPGAARRHCEVLVSREYPATVSLLFDWLVDEEDGDLAVAELVVQLDGGDEVTTGYTVTPIEVTVAFDPDADE
ncbi:hypothetical protein AB0K62_08790 [Streptomyces halstedii]|uniref:hypothetical protein n=1 Tax=Streptomyces halstedii TaxID=1944 RepID=UPI00346007DD